MEAHGEINEMVHDADRVAREDIARDAALRKKAARDGGYRALLHILDNGPGRLQALRRHFATTGIDVDAFGEAARTMSSGELLLLKAGVSLYNSALVEELALGTVALDDIVCRLDGRNLHLVMEAMVLRGR